MKPGFAPRFFYFIFIEQHYFYIIEFEFVNTFFTGLKKSESYKK